MGIRCRAMRFEVYGVRFAKGGRKSSRVVLSCLFRRFLLHTSLLIEMQTRTDGNREECLNTGEVDVRQASRL